MISSVSSYIGSLLSFGISTFFMSLLYTSLLNILGREMENWKWYNKTQFAFEELGRHEKMI